MTGDARLWEAQRWLLAATDAGSESSLCKPVLAVMPVDGVSVSLLTGTMNHTTLCASDPVAAMLDALQFDLGEGPCWQALDRGHPVLVPDVRGGDHSSWPHFGAGARESGAGSMFAFPLSVDDLDIGALDVYRLVPGLLPDSAMADGLALADTLAQVIVRRLAHSNEHSDGDPEKWEFSDASSRQEIHLATEMLTGQLDTDTDGAFAMLRAHAFSSARPVIEVARDVISQRLHFDGRTEPTGSAPATS